MLYDFGPRLLKLRKDKNLTQQMVVERAKGFDPNLRLSDSVLGKYESDLAVPRLTEAAALADVLNVSLLSAKLGSTSAFEELFVRYKNLLRKYSVVNGIFDEDLYQEQCVLFAHCIEIFDVNR